MHSCPHEPYTLQAYRRGEGVISDLYGFDTTRNAWFRPDTKGELPAPRSFHAMAACGSALYIFGGVGVAGRLNDLHQFDTRNST